MSEQDHMTWEQLKQKNPWKRLFDAPTSSLLREIWGEGTEYIHPDDRAAFASKKGDDYFVFDILPEPYRGNLKDPKLVILSLNPGYVSRLNRSLYCMLDIMYRKEFVEALKNNVLLKGESKIVFNEVDDVIGDGYWTRQLAELKKDLGNDETIYSKVALIQYIPYFSETFISWRDDGNLGTQRFSCQLIRRILWETDAIFLVMRSKNKWKKLIGNEMDLYRSRFVYNHNPICQKISKKNLDGDRGTCYYEMIKQRMKA